MWRKWVRFAHDFFQSDFTRKIIETYFTQIMLLGINFLSVVMFSRILGPIARGILATATTVVAIGVQFGNVGLHASNTYHIAQNRTILPIAIGNSCIVSIVLGCLISIFIWGLIFFEPLFIPIDGVALFLVSLLIPFSLAHLLFQNVLLGVQEIRFYNKIEVLVKFIPFLFVGFLVFFNIKNVEVILAANLIACALGLYFAWGKIQTFLQEKPTFSFAFLKKSFFYGLRSYIAAFFAFLVIRGDLLMVKYFLGFEQAGYYSIAANIADIVFIFPTIIGTILFPKLVAVTNQNEKLKLVKKTAFGVFVFMTLLSLGCLGFSRIIIVSLLGEVFSPSVPAFFWLLPGLVPLSVNVIFMNYFASIGIPWIVIFSPGLAALANIILNLKMIPCLGIIGASISSTICYSSMLIMSLLYFLFRGKSKEQFVKQE